MSSQNQVVSKLVLFSSVLTAGSTTSFGTMNTLGTEMSFSSISMKNVLGELYDQYDTFNIILNSVTVPQSPATYGAVGLNFNNIMLYMGGLAFKTSNTYSNITKTSQTQAMVGNFQIPTWVVNGPGTVLYFNDTFCNTFGKFEDYINITLSLRTPTGALQVPAGLYPQMVYNFTIVGVDGARPAQYIHKANELITMGSRLDGHNGSVLGEFGPPSNTQRTLNQSKFYLSK
jgi:hypothetical protein